jgi:hypothetical protein
MLEQGTVRVGLRSGMAEQGTVMLEQGTDIFEQGTDTLE